MKKIRENKKLLLIFLTVVLLLILLSSYIKTTEIELDSIFVQNQKDKVDGKELIFEDDQKIENEKVEQNQASAENENDHKSNSNETAAIEKVALIKEIKDPFRRGAEHINSAEDDKEILSELEEQKDNANQDLIFLEKNIIAENIIDHPNNSGKSFQSQIEVDKKLSPAKTNKKNIRLPFELLGIIKNKNNSAALFLYQGQTILKKEKEKIDIFKIEKINNKKLTISHQNEKRILYLWKEKNNGNQN